MELEVENQIKKPGWGFLLSSEALIVEAPSKADAQKFVRTTTGVLAIWASKFNRMATLVRYPGCNRPYRIPATMAAINYEQEFLVMTQPIVATPAIEIAELKLSNSLLPTIIRWMENPNIKGGIIRIPDERQVVLTQASAALVSGTDLKGATQRKRSDYWYLPDLEEMRLAIEQQGDGIFEFSWRGTDEKQSRWDRFTNRYWKVRDELGNVYQCFENVGVDQIEAPTLITA